MNGEQSALTECIRTRLPVLAVGTATPVDESIKKRIITIPGPPNNCTTLIVTAQFVHNQTGHMYVPLAEFPSGCGSAGCNYN